LRRRSSKGCGTNWPLCVAVIDCDKCSSCVSTIASLTVVGDTKINTTILSSFEFDMAWLHSQQSTLSKLPKLSKAQDCSKIVKVKVTHTYIPPYIKPVRLNQRRGSIDLSRNWYHASCRLRKDSRLDLPRVCRALPWIELRTSGLRVRRANHAPKQPYNNHNGDDNNYNKINNTYMLSNAN